MVQVVLSRCAFVGAGQALQERSNDGQGSSLAAPTCVPPSLTEEPIIDTKLQDATAQENT